MRRRQTNWFLGLHYQKYIPVCKWNPSSVGIYETLRLQIPLEYMFHKNNITSPYKFPLTSPLVRV